MENICSCMPLKILLENFSLRLKTKLSWIWRKHIYRQHCISRFSLPPPLRYVVRKTTNISDRFDTVLEKTAFTKKKKKKKSLLFWLKRTQVSAVIKY